MPNVYGVHDASRNPATDIRSSNSGGSGNLCTEAGKYEYAPDEPEMRRPTLGKTPLK
jgi:hypothetical protein